MSRHDNSIDRAISTILWTLDKSPLLVGIIAAGAAVGVDGTELGRDSIVVSAAILLTYFVAYGAGVFHKLIDEDKKERRL